MHFTSSRKARKDLRRATTIVGIASGILLSIPLCAHASPAWTSAVTFGGGGSDTGQAVKVDQDGNRYVTGAFSATAYFPVREQGASALKVLTAEGGTDAFLAKYDRSGTLLWLAQIGGAEDDQGFDLAFDSAANVYVTGMFTDSATFRGTHGTQKTVTGVGQTIFLAKYAPSGVLTWVQTGTTAFDSSNNGYGVAVDPVMGSVYVAGVSQGNTTFSSSNGETHSVAGPGTWHMVLVKFDTAGNFHWGQSNEASPNSVAHKVAVDAHNNVYATGWMEGQTTFYSHDGHDLTVTGFSGPVQSSPDFPGDAYVVKYDDSGNIKWVNHIGGYKAIGTDIATSADGKVSITGLVGNIGNGLPEQAETVVTSQPGGRNISLGGGIFTDPFNSDVFVATYDRSGVLLDARRFGGAQDEGGSGIAYDRLGNLIVAGIFQGKINIEGRTLTGKDSFNLFVAKFTADERGLDWAVEADGPGIGGFENDPRIGLTAAGDVLVTGAYEPSAQFDSFKLPSAGLGDGFLALLSAAGH
ncbi:MAG TPA: SBBP repeat-containing protein [Steroidobacteraceae bacterium]